MESLRVLAAIAAQYGMWIHHVDASNAFVRSDLNIPNYTEVPEGVESFEAGADGDMALELLKSLCGVHQSANLLHEKIKSRLIDLGFKPSSADASIFIGPGGIIMALYVDDALVIGRSEETIYEVKEEMKAFHPMKDYGRSEKVLGLRIRQLQDQGYVCIDQERYALEVLDEFGFIESRTQSTPLSPSVQLEGEGVPRLDRRDHNLFRRIIGRLTYLVIGTCADLALAVSYMHIYYHTVQP